MKWLVILLCVLLIFSGSIGSNGIILESAHPYLDNADQTWEYTLAGNPSAIDVVFDAQTEVESCYDYIYVTDGNDVNIAGSPFTGTSLAGKTKAVTGDTVKIRLTSDSSATYWGFGITLITEHVPRDVTPHIITTRTQLEAMSDDLDAYYELGADIDLSGANWTPIAMGFCG